MSYQIYQTNAAPFGYVRPITETVMIDDNHQHLNVAIPQTINYPLLTAHSTSLQTQPTAPTLQSVPNTVQYKVMSSSRLFRKSNKVEPYQNGEHDIKNNVSVNVISQSERNRKIIIATAILVTVFLVLLCIVISTILAVVSKLRPGVTGNLVNETFISYTEQGFVKCFNEKCGCIFQPCMNGGKCNSYTYAFNSFTCSCRTHYSGDYCQIYTNPCDSNPCSNNGICSVSSNSKGYMCSCNQGYTGNSCEKADPCAGNRCLNGATCSSLAKNYVCLCPIFFSGTYCQYWLWAF